jgi:molecular chaperone DnaK (HSP70)
MPLVRDAVKAFFGKEPRRDINPDEAVALGAALFAYSLSADDLRREAIEAAEEAYAVAIRQTGVARRVLADVERLRPADLGKKQLGDKLQSLLDEAEREIATAESFTPPETDELPDAVGRLRDELLGIERKAEELIERANAHGFDADDASGADLDAAADRLNRQLASAQAASEQAQSRLDEAEEHGRARKVELIDVTSHALGIASARDLFSIVIAKNTRIPAEQVRTFTTQQDGQTEVEIRVHQGPYARASENHGLGSFILEGITATRRMEPKIDVAFRIDENGILAVTARDSATRREQGIRIESPLALRQDEAAELVASPDQNENFG